MIRGTDVSLYQPINLPWREWKQAHDLKYMIARLTIGYVMDDTAYVHIDKAINENILVGAYHLLLPQYPMIEYYNPIRQAAAFLSVLDKSKIRVSMLDIEVDGLSISQVTNWCNYYDDNCDLPLILYGNTWYLNQLLKPVERFSKYHVMIAAYGPGIPTSVPPAGFYPFPEIWKHQPENKKFWQFAGDNGRLSPYTGRIDLSQYLGTEEELVKLFGGMSDEELSMGQKTEIREQLQIISDAIDNISDILEEAPQPLFRVRIKDGIVLNVRGGPDSTFPIIRQVTAGTELNVYGVAPLNGWYNIGVNEWISGNTLYSERI